MEKTESKVSEKSANKSVRFSKKTDEKFSTLSEKLGLSKQELFEQMVDYFFKSKKDPSDLNDEMLKKEISKGISNIMSIIQSQEKKSFAPILAEVREGNQDALGAMQEQRETWNFFLEQFKHLYFYNPETKLGEGGIIILHRDARKRGELLEKIIEDLKVYQQKVTTAITEQANHQSEVKNLRESFRILFERYMIERENLNSLLFNKDKAIEKLQHDYQALFKKI